MRYVSHVWGRGGQQLGLPELTRPGAALEAVCAVCVGGGGGLGAALPELTRPGAVLEVVCAACVWGGSGARLGLPELTRPRACRVCGGVLGARLPQLTRRGRNWRRYAPCGFSAVGALRAGRREVPA